MTKPSIDLEDLIGRGIAVCIGFAGIFVFIYQAYLFLRQGELFLFSVIDGMEIINRYTYFAGEWTMNPQDWTGLHLIMSWVPLAPVLFFLGLYIGNMDN